MDNRNNLNYSNKYVQGSIWHWKSNPEKKEGVQSGERPVLIISNNAFNYHSPSVNCVTITSVLKDSPVHVPLYITKDSHIQCEQIHTISKSELTDYKGIVSNSLLSSVKAKLRIQFDMSTDRNTELFNTIKENLEELNSKTQPEILNSIKTELTMLREKADNGFGVPEIEKYILDVMNNLHNSIRKIETHLEKANSEAAKSVHAMPVDKAERSDHADSKSEHKTIKKSRGKRKNYTNEDKIFIADKRNSPEVLMEKYGYDRPTALKMRAYFKKHIGSIERGKSDHLDAKIPAAKKSKSITNSKYTDEDIEFVLNTDNSPADIMERFDLTEKRAAYNIRKYIKQIGSETI